MTRCICAALASLLVSCLAQDGGKHSIKGPGIDGREGIIGVLEDGELFTEYHYDGVRVPSLYPIHGPGGVPITRAWPFEEREGEEHDHTHHTSLWLAHGDVNGHDFWHGEENSIVNTEAILCSSGGDTCTMQARNRWMAGEELLLFEDRVMVFEIEDDRRVLDFDIVLTPAIGAVTFGDTKEGTFAIRMHPELRLSGDIAKGVAVNSEGIEGKDIWGKRARWVAYSAPVEGQEVTVVLMDHPRNLRHPTWWHARDYGLCAANPFGVHDFEGQPEGAGNFILRPTEALRLRYRILLLEGALDVDDIEDEWDDYAP